MRVVAAARGGRRTSRCPPQRQSASCYDGKFARRKKLADVSRKMRAAATVVTQGRRPGGCRSTSTSVGLSETGWFVATRRRLY